MKIVVGLGNPGREYARTRHNLGFMVLDRLAKQLEARPARSRFRSELAEARYADEKLLLVKPQTYMNLSGHAVREVLNWYHLESTDLMIVVDDLDLPLGSIRLRGKGSAGGHNGLKSIFEQLGTTEVPRMRIGIGRRAGTARAQVLSRFAPDEESEVPAIVGRAAECCLVWIEQGIETAMNRCNQRPAPPAATAPEAESPEDSVRREPPEITEDAKLHGSS